MNWRKLFKLYNNNGLTILMYHHIGPDTENTGSVYFIEPEVFAAQLDLIKKKGFYPLSLDELENAFLSNTKLPPKSVFITLDDGWEDNYQYAFPIAKEKQVPVTVFLSTGQIGIEKDMLNWKQVKEMSESGYVSFSSHGVNHKSLRKLSNEDILSELQDSKKTLEDFFKKPMYTFCYPYGAFDNRVRPLVFQSGYKLDIGTRKGINHWPWKKFRPLLRAHVLKGESLKEFYTELLTGRK